MKKHRIINFLKKFPIQIIAIFLIPNLIYSFSFLFSTEYLYNNLYYDGEIIPADHEYFELTGIKRVADVMQVASMFSYQGGACCGNYYTVVADNFEAILIYNTVDMSVEHSISTGIINTDWHCNQIFFGKDYYSASDKFPLLYISMESAKVHSLIAFRIYQLSGVYYVKQIQKIELIFDDNDVIYYPNAYYDYSNEIVYYAGYTKKTYMNQPDNYLRYYQFALPDYRIETYEFHTSQSLEAPFELPSETATQGGFISEGYLYQAFSFASKTDPLKTPKMRIVNLATHTIVYENENLGASFGVYKEFEHLAVDNGGRMYSLGNPFDIYEFEYVRLDYNIE